MGRWGRGGPWLSGMAGCSCWDLVTWLYVLTWQCDTRVGGALPPLEVGAFSLALECIWHWTLMC